METKHIIIEEMLHSKLKSTAKSNRITLSKLCSIILAEKLKINLKESEKITLKEIFDIENKYRKRKD